MRMILSWIRACLGRNRPRSDEKLTRSQSRILRKNLRAILLSKEALADRNETAA